MQISDAHQVVGAIYAGLYDDTLDTLSEAIKNRVTNLEQRQIATLKKGDTVRFNSKTRPKYLVGVEAVVIKVNKTTVTVDIPSRDTFERFGGIVRVPASLLELA